MNAEGADSPLALVEAVEDHAPEHVPAAEPIVARLVRGISYRLQNTVWNRERGSDAHPVDAETEAYLREHAPGAFWFSNDVPAL